VLTIRRPRLSSLAGGRAPEIDPIDSEFQWWRGSQNPTTQLLDLHRLNMEHGTVRDPNLSHSLTIGFNASWWQYHFAAKTERAPLDSD
jgi:hypothetical protein